MRMVTVALGAVLALALIAAAPTHAQSDRELDLRVQEITEQLRCPTCQGLSVRDSEAAFSRQMAQKVRRMLSEGQSEEQIKAYFVSRYGEWILRAPKKEGLGLVLWLAPGVALVAVGGLVLYRVRRTGRDRETAARNVREQQLSDAQRERIRKDLRRFEEGE